METDYSPGDEPVPVGTLVDYFGSLTHGRYEIIETHDPETHPYRRHLDTVRERYPDGVAYDLWPVGVPRKFGNRDQGVNYVRRTSFRVCKEGDKG